MSKRLISHNPHTGVSTWYQDGGIVAQSQDVAPYLERNKKLQNDPSYKAKMLKGDEYYHYATVPAAGLLDMKEKYGLDWRIKEHLPRIEKLLASREYAHFRTVDRI